MSGREILGFALLVRLPVLEALLGTSMIEPNALLSSVELQLWTRQVTKKRRLEFLAGRIAAKLVQRIAQRRPITNPRDWVEMRILPDSFGRPLYMDREESRHSLGISHSGMWAIAATGVNGRLTSVDLEDSCLARVGDQHLHPLERFQVSDLDDMRLRWCIKEACAKFTGIGIIGFERDVVVLSLEGRLWAGLCRSHILLRPAFLTSANLSRFSVAFAVGEVQSRAM